MNVNFFVTCIGDALKSRMARDSVLLLEKLGCRVNFPEKQGCCGQPAINSGYIKEAIPGMKNLIAALEDNDDPIISPAGSCTYAVKSYPTYLADEPEWASRAAKVAARMQDLTSFIVNKLGVVDVGASLQGRAVYHPSCSLARKLGVKDEPLTLLKNVRGLELLTFAEQDTCCGFGGTFRGFNSMSRSLCRRFPVTTPTAKRATYSPSHSTARPPFSITTKTPSRKQD